MWRVMGRKVVASSTHRQDFKFSMRRFEIQERYWEAMIGNWVQWVVPQVPVQPCTVPVHCGRPPKLSESLLLAATGQWTVDTLKVQTPARTLHHAYDSLFKFDLTARSSHGCTNILLLWRVHWFRFRSSPRLAHSISWRRDDDAFLCLSSGWPTHPRLPRRWDSSAYRYARESSCT